MTIASAVRIASNVFIRLWCLCVFCVEAKVYPPETRLSSFMKSAAQDGL